MQKNISMDNCLLTYEMAQTWNRMGYVQGHTSNYILDYFERIIKHTKGNVGDYFYLYSFKKLVQRHVQRSIIHLRMKDK
jgi:hypothetical protein